MTSPDRHDGPIDPIVQASLFIAWLDDAHQNIMALGPIPPIDHDILASAREVAATVAEENGRGPGLREAQRMVADWTLARYRTQGFGAAYLTGWQDDPERRVELMSALVDAVTAYSLLDILPDETVATLVARFDVAQGGPIWAESTEGEPD